MILGIDVSTSIVGFAIIDHNYNLKVYEKIKFKSNMPLEQRAQYFKNKISHYDNYYLIDDVFVEQPAMMFGRGKTTANTMAKLQRFNGMCCYACFEVLQIVPTLIHANSARKRMNIRVPRNVKNKKHYIIERVAEEYPSFKFNLTRFGNPQPGTDDMADAIVVAHAGVSIKEEMEYEIGETEDTK